MAAPRAVLIPVPKSVPTTQAELTPGSPGLSQLSAGVWCFPLGICISPAFISPSLCIAAITDTLKHNDLAVSVMDDRTFLSASNHCPESANFPGLTPSCPFPAHSPPTPGWQLLGECSTAMHLPHAWGSGMAMDEGLASLG